MKRRLFSLLTIAILIGLTGCIHQYGRRPWACMGGSCAQAPENCQSCTGEPCNGSAGEVCADPGRCRRCLLGNGCGLCRGGRPVEEVAAGPATGAVTYPYYTTRGPRDFLAKNPPSIGP